MTGLIILLTIFVLLLLLLFCLRLGAEMGYDHTGLWLTLNIGPVRVQLLPRDPDKAARRARRKAARARRKQARLERKEKKPQKQKKGEKIKLPPGGALELALELLPQVQAMLRDLRYAIRIDDLAVQITWGQEDPADAAINYGRAWGLLEAGLAFLEANFEVRHREASVELDYRLGSPVVALRAAVSAAPAPLLRAVLPLVIGALKGVLALRKEMKGQKTTEPAAAAGQERKGEPNNGEQPSCQ